MISTRISIAQMIRVGCGKARAAWKMLVVLYLANLFCALLVALPLLASLEQSFSESAAADRVLAGFDYDWFSQAQAAEQNGVGRLELSMVGPGIFFGNYELLISGGFLDLPPLLLAVIVLYLLIQVFFSGGILSLLGRPETGFKLAEFLRESGSYFLRFLRILLLGFTLLAAGVSLIGPIFNWVRERLQSSGSESLEIAGGWMLTLFAGLLLAAWAMLGDYTRIRMVQDHRSSGVFSGLAAIHLFSRRPLTMVGVYLTFSIAGLFLAAGVSLLERAVIVDSAALVLLACGFQQLYMLARIGMRMALLASQTALYQKYRIPNKTSFPERARAMNKSMLRIAAVAGVLMMPATVTLSAQAAGQEKQLLIRLKNGKTVTFSLEEIESIQFVNASGAATSDSAARDASPANARQTARSSADQTLGPLRLVAGSPGFSGATGPANLFDGNSGTGWSSRPDARFPHDFQVEFPRPAAIGAVEFDNATQESTYPGSSAREVTILASNSGPMGPWTAVASVTLARGANQQRFTIAPVTAKWIRVLIRANYGHPNYTQLMDIRFYPAGELRRTP